MRTRDVRGDLGPADAAKTCGSAGQTFVDDLIGQANGLEELCAMIAVERRNAHLGHDLAQTFVDGIDIIALRNIRVERLAGALLIGEMPHGLECQEGMDRFSAVADQTGDLMHITRLAGIDDQAAQSALAGAQQVLMHAAGRQQCRDRCFFTILRPVGDDQQRCAVAHCRRGCLLQFRRARLVGRFHHLPDSIRHESSGWGTRVGCVAR